MSIEKLSMVWPEWKVTEMLGEGAFGKVYKAVREEHSMTTYSAIKVITIPQNGSEVAELKAEGLDDNSTKTYFQGIVDDFINEIKLMESMKGISNIVSVEDFKVLEKQDVLGWDIFIRMELLTPFTEYVSKKSMTEAEVIKLGIDVCSALELCAQKNIIHRDIKPENIFVSGFGDFKVGDFGIARELEKTNGTLSSKGTSSYMAPEVVMGKKYNATVDTYSLGLVLYKLFNNNRLPFINPNAQQIQYQERKSANDRRLCGEPLPAPINASRSMTAIILQACSFNPDNRFANATAFKNALIALQNGVAVDLDATVAAVSSHNSNQTLNSNLTAMNTPYKSSAKTAKKRGMTKIIIIAAIAVLLIGGGVFAITRIAGNSQGNTTEAVNKDSDNDVANNDETTSNKEINSKDYEEAKKEFDESGKVTDELVNGLNNRMDIILNEFINESTDYYSAKLELEDIADMNVVEVQDKLTKVQNDIESLYASRQAFDAAQIYEENSDYINAISEYKKVVDIDTDYETAKKKIIYLQDQYRTQVLNEASTLAADKDYLGAIEELDKGLGVLNEDTQLTKQIAVYETSYVTDVISQSDALLKENKYDEAIKMVEEAQKIVENNSSLEEQLENINNQKPKNFMEVCKPYDTTADNYTEYMADVMDGFMMAGTECKNGFTIFSWEEEYYVLSNLNGEYTNLEFDVGHIDGSPMYDVTLIIFLDDKDSFTYEITTDGYPQHITLDVTDVNQIKFFIKKNCGNFYKPVTGFSDMTIK